MAKMTGLGKGLDALFGPAPEEEQIKENDSLKNLKITEVEPNRDQPRKRFDQEALEELASSIKEYGLIQPIVVTKKDGYYSIIAGERRWRASKIAGLKEIPAIIREDDEKINSEISLIENMQREDLNPVEKAMGIKTLIDNYGMSQEEVAKKLGKGRSTIANWVRVLNLEPRVLEMAKEGKISEGYCKALLAITDPEKQYQTAIQMLERGQTVRQVEKKAKVKETREEQRRNHILYKNIEDTFPIQLDYAPSGDIFMLRVKGDSMINAGIFNKDLIMVKRQSTAENGDIVVALIEDFATVKTFYKENDYIRLQPENPSMSPILVRDVTIIGKVVGLYRRY